MRKLLILLLVAGASVEVRAASPPLTRLLTLDQIEEVIAGSETDDGGLADRLSKVRLRERLTDERLAALMQQLPGRRSRQLLIALADESTFFQPPLDQIQTGPVPDRAAQRALYTALVAYVRDQVNRWPSFYVTRTTTRYEGTAQAVSSGLHDRLFPPRLYWPSIKMRSPVAQNWECPRSPKYDKHRLSVMDTTSFVSIYRGGHEVRILGEAGGEFACPRDSVNTADQFGELPLLFSFVLSRGRLSWDHWEKGPAGNLAVIRYRFTIPLEMKGGPAVHPPWIEIQGELAAEVGTGTVRWLTAQRRWTVEGYVDEYSTRVDFAPVDVGGAQWVLPVRRIALFRAPFLKPPTAGKSMAKLYRKFGLTESPLQEYLNDVRYAQYRPYAAEPRTATVRSGGAQPR